MSCGPGYVELFKKSERRFAIMAFNTESLQLNNMQQNLENTRFAVEKITDTFLAQDNKIYYKVKWQETWEPEERLINICGTLINEFWKEYYTRTQQQQQQQQHGIQAISQQQQASSSQHDNRNLNLLQQNTDMQQQQCQQQQTLSHPEQKKQSTSGDDIAQLLQTSIASSLTETPVSFTSAPTSTLQSESNISTESNSAGVDNTLQSALQIEFRIQGNGAEGEKDMPQMMLQQRFIESATSDVSPRFPFLPTFSNLQESTTQSQETTETTVSTTENTIEAGVEVIATTSKTKTAKKLACSICMENFSSRALLKQHKARHEFETHPCGQCSKTFPKKAALKRHMLSHNTSRPHVCDQCGKGFKDRSNLTKHLVIHTGERPHQCSTCKASFRQLGHLIKHSLIHKPEKPFQCDVCKKKFRRKEHVKDHMIIHSGEYPYHCELCPKKFRFKTNLKVHILQHEGRRDHVCDICNKAFVGKANLTQHRLTHNPTVIYPCDVCSKTFSRKAHLQRHMSIHRSEGVPTCIFCKETFTDRATYKKHMLTHTGSKPYVCSQCDKRFATKSYLQQHMALHQGDGKNLNGFTCETCGKTFQTSSNLQRHQATHNRKKEFFCRRCQKGFLRKSAMDKHEINCGQNSKSKELPKNLLPVPSVANNYFIPNMHLNLTDRGTLKDLTLAASFDEAMKRNFAAAQHGLGTSRNTLSDVVANNTGSFREVDTRNKQPDFTKNNPLLVSNLIANEPIHLKSLGMNFGMPQTSGVNDFQQFTLPGGKGNMQ